MAASTGFQEAAKLPGTRRIVHDGCAEPTTKLPNGRCSRPDCWRSMRPWNRALRSALGSSRQVSQNWRKPSVASACLSKRLLITQSSCSIRRETWSIGTRAPSGSKAMAREEIIGQHFSLFYTEQDRQSGRPAAGDRNGSTDRQIRSGGLARPQGRQRSSGQASSSTRSTIRRVSCWDLPRSRAI